MPSKHQVASSILAGNTEGSLAQGLEQCTHNAKVIGSNPIRPTKYIAGWSGVVPARSHKPNHASSNLAPATISSGRLAGLGHQVFILKIMGSNPIRNTISRISSAGRAGIL